MFTKFSISRIILSMLMALLLVTAVTPIAAHAQSGALTASTYSGSYRAGARRGTVSFTILRGIRAGMWEGSATVNKQQLYSNGLVQRDGSMIVNIFSLDANYNQVQVATIHGKFSATGTTFSGSISINGRAGSVMMRAR